MNVLRLRANTIGKTQEDISDELGIHQSAVSRLERRGIKPAKMEIQLIADAYEIDSEKLRGILSDIKKARGVK